jgi:hypothetical protein
LVRDAPNKHQQLVLVADRQPVPLLQLQLRGALDAGDLVDGQPRL